MASEIPKHLGTEGMIREKNRLLDILQSDSCIGYLMRYAPGLKIFNVADPDTARCLMSLRPEFVEKAGLSDMLFGDDPNGFIGGLVYEEGATWQKSRRILNEEFNQASLDSYIDAMDESVQAYVEKLKTFDEMKPVMDVRELTNQLTLEVMLKTVFGDRSFNLIAINGQHEIFTAFKAFCKFSIFFFENIKAHIWSNSDTDTI